MSNGEKVQRYDFAEDGMDRDAHGDYVKYDDIAHLLAKPVAAALPASNEQSKQHAFTLAYQKLIRGTISTQDFFGYAWDTALAATPALPAEKVQGLTNSEIRTIMHNYSRMHQPGHYSDTEFDCLQDVIGFARAILAASGGVPAPAVPTREQIIEASGDVLLRGGKPGEIEYDVALVAELARRGWLSAPALPVVPEGGK